MNETQKRIYDFIYHLCTSCKFLTGTMPVLLTRHDIAKKLCLSDKTVQRNLEWLIDNKYIYRVEYNRLYIYNVNPIDTTYDFICRIRV